MTRSIALNNSAKRAPSLSAMLHELWPTRPSRSRQIIDVRELPDHIKRDLGILDGSRPVGGVQW